MASTLTSRIESAIRTANQWENDKTLLTEIRSSIPFKELVPELVCEVEGRWRSYLNKSADGGEGDVDANEGDNMQYKTSCFKGDDDDWEGDDLLLKRLTIYFKQEVMSWCDHPPCSNPNCKGNEDGKQMESKGMRGPETEEEKTGGANRVEVYRCQFCNTETTFPRFNSPRALLKSRRGRCGEFANLFGTYCRALGFDTRYILDFTDHVWVEVWSVRQQRWLHADSCEGLIDRPNMYEQGWGKKLNYVVGATHDSVADVTKRYTRKFYTDEFQARRREFTPNENKSEMVFLQMGGSIRHMSSIGKGRLNELDKRGKEEKQFFTMVQSSGVWDVDYREGRISGSLAWKAARQEMGENKEVKERGGEKDDEQENTHSFFVECFYPSSNHNDLTILLQPPRPLIVPSTAPTSHRECITVNGVPCATTLMNGVSVVVIDEASGCILQSKAFTWWASVGSFLHTVPNGRIVAICSIRDEKEDGSTNDSLINEPTSKNLSRLGGFTIDLATNSSGIFCLFVGQLNYHPSWATSLKTSDSTQALKVTLQLNITSPPKLRLRSEAKTVPAKVSTRLPESIMPLRTQLVASNFQKHVAFKAYCIANNFPNLHVVGYTTQPKAPVYLIDKQSFPFRRSDGHTHNPNANDTSWVTYHFLPDPLVVDDDGVTEEAEKRSSSNNTSPKVNVPVAEDYFMGLLGNQLIVKDASSTPTLIGTTAGLANTRLVALYFSAHWCGPCRGFTPSLIEFYNFLKEVAPIHGLEIVFVSSDRDEGQFQQYYEQMPFLALPFSNRALAQQLKSAFGVRGIPCLVVIDSLSGSIVTSPDESRRDVHQACQRGEQAIERLFQDWLDNVPLETKSMLDILALSLHEVAVSDSSGGDAYGVAAINTKAESYLSRKVPVNDEQNDTVQLKDLTPKQTFEARVKELFPGLVAKGMEPNAAAAEAIKQATAKQKNISISTTMEEGRLRGKSEKCAVESGSNTIEAMVDRMCQLNGGDQTKVANVLSTAEKYVINVRKDPSNPRFRTFCLSNKVFDRITSTKGGLELLMNLGFVIFHSDVDFVASVPLSVDHTVMGDVFTKLLKAFNGRERANVQH